MKKIQNACILFSIVLLALPAAAKRTKDLVPLTAEGEKFSKFYAADLQTLREELIGKLPRVEAQKEKAFSALRAQWNQIPSKNGEIPPAEVKRIEALREKVELESMTLAEEILKSHSEALKNDDLDAKLMRVAVLTHGTPRGFAEFAQKGADHKKLLDDFFSDRELMRQVLEAGGANGGAYGEMLEVYHAILAQSERARNRGSIFQRLALGMAIQMPWTKGKPKHHVHGIVYRTRYDVDQVKRFLHFEQAHLADELDPAFKDLSSWECRFVGNGQYSEEDMAWFRKMLRNYRPDHITMKDYKWKYIRFIKSDVPYTSTTHDPSLGTPAQEHIALGGICGRRAFLGRLSTRAFGIPSRASTQSGHGAMSHWTPEGWVVCLGAWWSQAWCGPQGGLDFLLDSQAREFEDYEQVRRMQWMGDVMNQSDVSIGHNEYGKKGGFWDSLAFVKKQIMVKQAEVKALELVGGMNLGESDNLIGDEVGEKIKIPSESKQLRTSADGVISIPAVSCYSPRTPSDRILFLQGLDQSYRLHYSRLGSRPELFKYRIEVPAEGTYLLSCNAVTVSPNLQVLVRINRDEPIPFSMPYTKGQWQDSKSIKVRLKQGRNTISVTARTPNRGVSLKSWTLKPAG